MEANVNLTPYSNYQLEDGTFGVVVPEEAARTLLQREQALLEVEQRGIEPCHHPEDDRSGLEMLPDMQLCNRCGALLKMADDNKVPGVVTWLRADMQDLEAALYTWLHPLIRRIEIARMEIGNHDMRSLIDWQDEVYRSNPYIEK
jgi:hypothetical protein